MNKFISVFLVTIGGCTIVWFFLSPMGQNDVIGGVLGIIMLAQGLYCIVQSFDQPDHWCNVDWDGDG